MDPRLARTDLLGSRRLIAAKRSLTGGGSGSITAGGQSVSTWNGEWPFFGRASGGRRHKSGV
jgi:hypothetical protein